MAVFLKSYRKRKTKTIEEIKVLLDLVLHHAQRDQMPYLTVNILGRTILELLKSSASSTIANQFGLEFLQSVGLKIKQLSSTKCTVANGSPCTIIGEVATPTFYVLIVPDMNHPLILGITF